MEQLCSVVMCLIEDCLPERLRFLSTNSLTQASELELESPANRHGGPPASGIHALGYSSSSQSLELASGYARVCLRPCMSVGGGEIERQRESVRIWSEKGQSWVAFKHHLPCSFETRSLAGLEHVKKPR